MIWLGIASISFAILIGYFTISVVRDITQTLPKPIRATVVTASVIAAVALTNLVVPVFYLVRIRAQLEAMMDVKSYEARDLDTFRGLVRAAEMIEQRDGGKVWDDSVRRALEKARAAGWGNDKIGRPL